MPTSCAYSRLSTWGDRLRRAVLGLLVASGTTAARASALPERLSVEPAEIRLDGGGSRQQVAVTGHFADGSVRDLTAEASFAVEPSGMARASETGVVTPQVDGSGALRVEVAGKTATVPIRVVGAVRARPASYRLGVAALLTKAGCNAGACHGNLNGKGGFRLSLRGDDPTFDLAMLTRDASGRRVDRIRPEGSLIVLKPSGRLPHEGGTRFAPGSPEEQTLLGWIAAGALDDDSAAPRPVRLTVSPAERMVAAPGRAQQLVVAAEFADGSRRDVTGEVAYDVSDPTRASVTIDGKVEARGPVEVAVSLRYLGLRATSRLAFLPDRPDFAWRGPEPANVVDVHVFAKLKALTINPSPPADDAAFLRRAFLDALGVLPGPEEARAFLADRDPEKRAKLVGGLPGRPEFADFWALKWADLLRNEEKSMGDKGVWVFTRWLRDQMARDVPLDEFARSLVASRGTTYRDPPTSFYRTNRDPTAAAEAVGQVFLGVRLQCARCHNHPFDRWTQDDYYGLAAYFGNLARKQVNDARRDKFDKHLIMGDEVLYLAGSPGMIHPRTGSKVAPKPPGGPSPALGDGPDARDDLAEWLTRDNPQFARTMANRVWYHLLGRGIVEPVDDFRDSNPPSNPALLDALTAEFVRGGMRLRPLVTLIMKSRTYALGAKPEPTNRDDEANFARASVRLLPAEVLLDAIGQALGRREPFPAAPGGARAVQLAGAKAGGDFLKVFGKPERLLSCECERSDAITLAQAFQLINGEAVRVRLEAPDNRIGRLLLAGLDDPTILAEVYLATLGREPGDAEREGALAHLAKAPDRRKAWEDVAWAILNSKEFLLRH